MGGDRPSREALTEWAVHEKQEGKKARMERQQEGRKARMERQHEATTRQGRPSLPKGGCTLEELRRLMAEARKDDADWRNGRIACHVYYAGDDILQVAQEAYVTFFSENGLGTKSFPSLRRFETEVMAMTAALLHGDQAVGNISSGGTESNLLAVKTARDRARVEKPAVTAPEMVVPVSGHPSFNKAGHYFGVKVVRTPVGEDFRADVSAIRAAITGNTVLIVGSAPCYPYGVVDPIEAMARTAKEGGISFHVDACVGGFMLPFLEKLGYPIPPFDFRVDGVTSMSADLHKYGFTAKGASILLHRDEEARSYQGFEFCGGPTASYSTPTMAGTRPGGAIAAAWAVMRYLGEGGYLQLARRIMMTSTALVDGINGIAGLEVLGRPDMSVFAYGSRSLDISAIGDVLADRGWYVSRQAQPPSIHITVTPAHEPVAASYLDDLSGATALAVRNELTSRGTEVTYH